MNSTEITQLIRNELALHKADISSLIRQELDTFKSDLLSLLAPLLDTKAPSTAPPCTAPMQQPEARPQAPTRPYSLYFQASWDATQTVTENLDRISQELDTSFGIYTVGKNKKQVYKTPTQHSKTLNLKFQSSDKPLTPILQKAVTDLAVSSPPAPSPELHDVNKALNINAASTKDVARKVLHKGIAGRFLDMDDIETFLNYQTSMGPMHYLKAKNLKVARGYSFDINSHHPYMLTTSHLIPTRPGKPAIVTKESIDTAIPAIYVVESPNFFCFRKSNDDPSDLKYVSNYLIQFFIDTDTPFELVTIRNNDERYNAYLYDPADCIPLGSIIGQDVHALYALKPTNTVARSALQTLFGKMIQRDLSYNLVDTSANFSLGPNDTIERVSETQMKIITDNLAFKLPTGRLKTFFYNLANIYAYDTFIKPHADKLLRVKVDSFLFTENVIESSHIGPGIGQLKREYKLKNATIPHVNVCLSKLPNVLKYDPEDDTFYYLEDNDTAPTVPPPEPPSDSDSDSESDSDSDSDSD